MTVRITPQVRDELERIRTDNGGLLRPDQVRIFAQNAETSLHAWFAENNAFDQEHAVQQYQLQLARRLIMTVNVTIAKSANRSVTVRAYTSLKSDRLNGEGYRATIEVLNDEERRAEMLQTALQELEALQRKYSDLQALAPVFEAMRQIAA